MKLTQMSSSSNCQSLKNYHPKIVVSFSKTGSGHLIFVKSAKFLVFIPNAANRNIFG